jgi:Thrombospondin type 3 repeat
MRKAWRGWRDLPFEKQLAIVVAPLLIAVVAGVLVPVINRALEPNDPPKVSGARLSNIHVERHVTLEEFTARQQTAGDPTAAPDESRESGVRAVAVLMRLTDQDGDGVDDDQDACPDQAGTSNGCPTGADQDGDGVDDDQDACPDQAGTSNGCPAERDRDGDRVSDNVTVVLVGRARRSRAAPEKTTTATA